jgi:hypothetical protein
MDATVSVTGYVMDHSPKNCGESSFLFTLIFFFFPHLRITTGLKMFCKYFDPLLLVGMEEEEDVVIVMTRPCICM